MENDTRNHIREERLEAYAMNSLARDEVATLEEHLLFCTTCQDKLEAIERYTQAMKGAAKRIREEEQSQAPVTPGAWGRLKAWLHTPAPIWTGAFAMVAVIVMVGLQLGQRPGAPVDVELQAVRGASSGSAQAGHALHLLMDNRGIPEASWHIEIVNEEGTSVWSGIGTWANSAIQATADKSFKPGTYFVRLLKPGEDPIREYQLQVHP
jgi:hypothetical protein